MHPKANLYKLLQATLIGPIADFVIWVPSLPAGRCVSLLSNTVYAKQGYLGFAFSGSRIYKQQPKRSISVLLGPVEEHSSIDSQLDPSNPPWPAVDSEKRLVLIDVDVPDQTGAFYAGTMIRYPKYDRFLTTTEVSNLSIQQQTELVASYDGGTSVVDRAVTWAKVKSGELRVPCVCLQYALADDFILDIDAVLIDAAVRGRATLAGWELDASGRRWPEEDKGNQQQKLEEMMAAMNLDVEDLQQRVRASQSQQVAVKAKINDLGRKLGLSSSRPRAVLPLPTPQQSPNKRG
ncbi:hypothetical protein FS837_008693, partial [Tulasnella sp. UAMH 9824]